MMASNRRNSHDAAEYVGVILSANACSSPVDAGLI